MLSGKFPCEPSQKIICGFCGQVVTDATSCSNEECTNFRKRTFRPSQLLTLSVKPQIARLASGTLIFHLFL